MSKKIFSHVDECCESCSTHTPTHNPFQTCRHEGWQSHLHYCWHSIMYCICLLSSFPEISIDSVGLPTFACECQQWIAFECAQSTIFSNTLVLNIVVSRTRSCLESHLLIPSINLKSSLELILLLTSEQVLYSWQAFIIYYSKPPTRRWDKTGWNIFHHLPIIFTMRNAFIILFWSLQWWDLNKRAEITCFMKYSESICISVFQHPLKLTLVYWSYWKVRIWIVAFRSGFSRYLCYS